MVDFAVGVVAALRVDEAIGGIHVEEVATGRGGTVEPALGPGVLTVPAVAFLLIVATQAAAWAIFDVGIDVPNLAIGFAIGVSKGVEESTVADHMMAFDDVVQGGFEFIAGLAVGVVVITIWNLGLGGDACDSQQYKKCVFFHGKNDYPCKDNKFCFLPDYP